MNRAIIRWLEAQGLPGWLAPSYVMTVALAGFLGAMSFFWLVRRDKADKVIEGRALLFGYLAALAGGYVFEAVRAVPAVIASGSLSPLFHVGRAAYGGLIAGVLVPVFVLRRYRAPVRPFLDRSVPVLGIAYASVRTGCFLAGCDYGRSTAGALGVRFPPGSPAAMDHASLGWVPAGGSSLPVHATQLYEAALGAVASLVAAVWLARGYRDGRAFCTWLGVYAIGRFSIEFLRGDRSRGVYGGLSSAQIVSIAILIGIAAVLLRAWRDSMNKSDTNKMAPALGALLAVGLMTGVAEGQPSPPAASKTTSSPAAPKTTSSPSAPKATSSPSAPAPSPPPPPAPSASAPATSQPPPPPPPAPSASAPAPGPAPSASASAPAPPPAWPSVQPQPAPAQQPAPRQPYPQQPYPQQPYPYPYPQPYPQQPYPYPYPYPQPYPQPYPPSAPPPYYAPPSVTAPQPTAPATAPTTPPPEEPLVVVEPKVTDQKEANKRRMAVTLGLSGYFAPGRFTVLDGGGLDLDVVARLKTADKTRVEVGVGLRGVLTGDSRLYSVGLPLRFQHGVGRNVEMSFGVTPGFYRITFNSPYFDSISAFGLRLSSGIQFPIGSSVVFGFSPMSFLMLASPDVDTVFVYDPSFWVGGGFF